VVAVGSKACVLFSKLLFYDALGLCW